MVKGLGDGGGFGKGGEGGIVEYIITVVIFRVGLGLMASTV